VQDDLGVGRGAQAYAACLELVAQLESVVGLAVVDDLETAVRCGHGHQATRLEVDNGQPAGGQAYAWAVVNARAVRPAMDDLVAHPRRRTARWIAAIEVDHAGYPAHWPDCGAALVGGRIMSR